VSRSPMRCMTARDGVFTSAVKETMRASPIRSKPARSAARAPSVA